MARLRPGEPRLQARCTHRKSRKIAKRLVTPPVRPLPPIAGGVENTPRRKRPDRPPIRATPLDTRNRRKWPRSWCAAIRYRPWARSRPSHGDADKNYPASPSSRTLATSTLILARVLCGGASQPVWDGHYLFCDDRPHRPIIRPYVAGPLECGRRRLRPAGRCRVHDTHASAFPASSVPPQDLTSNLQPALLRKSVPCPDLDIDVEKGGPPPTPARKPR